jgi:nucleoside-diphosphate-sugar epimerase
MTVLVTGGGGFLGLYITEQLRARGDCVRVFCRTSSPRFAEIGAEHVAGDIRDAAAVERACRGVDTVFHVAALPGVWGPWNDYFETNTRGTEHVIAACRKLGISKLIYTSSPSVIYDGREHRNVDESYPYPEPDDYLCHYPYTKALAEQLILAANGQNGLVTVALRPHLIWGPRDNHLLPRLIRRAAAGRLRRVGDGQNLISMSYVENTADAHLKAADALAPSSPVAGQVYFINEPEPVNLWSWIDELLALAGLPRVAKRISAVAAWRIGAACEAVYTLLRLRREPPMTRFVASQLASTHYYDTSKARRDFGYQPQVSVEEGMRRLAPALRNLAGNSAPP